MRMFKFTIPGYGVIFVRGMSQGEAYQGALRFVNQHTDLMDQGVNATPQPGGEVGVNQMNSQPGAPVLESNGKVIGQSSRNNGQWLSTDANRPVTNGQPTPSGYPGGSPATAQPGPINPGFGAAGAAAEAQGVYNQNAQPGNAETGAGLLDEMDPLAAIYRGLAARGVGAGRNMRDRFERAQSGDFENTFSFGSALQGFGGGALGLPTQNERDVADSESALEQFTRQYGTGAMRRKAGDVFSAARNLGSNSFEGLHDLFNSPNEFQANSLADLGRTALSSKVSPLGLRLIDLPSGAESRGQYNAQTAGGGTNYLDFFRKLYGLDRVGF